MCQIKCQYNFKFYSVLYFTCNHIWNWNYFSWWRSSNVILFQRQWTRWKIFVNHNKPVDFPRTEIKLLQMDDNEGWNNFISHVTAALAHTMRRWYVCWLLARAMNGRIMRCGIIRSLAHTINYHLGSSDVVNCCCSYWVWLV